MISSGKAEFCRWPGAALPQGVRMTPARDATKKGTFLNRPVTPECGQIGDPRVTHGPVSGHTESVSRLLAAGVVGLLALADASCGGSASSAGTDGGSSGSSPAGSSSGEGANSSSSGGNSEDGGSPGDAQSQSSSGAGSMPDSTTAGGDSSTACSSSGGGGTFGSEECTTMMQETCGSTTYYATCACPEGSCGCVGPTTRVVNFTGCPYCPTQMPMEPGVFTSFPDGTGIPASEVFALCGFPH
jgi:hypothetical protein